MKIKERIEERQKIRAEIANREGFSDFHRGENTLLLISESIDDYIKHRIQTDKVQEGILKDIQGNLAEVNIRPIEKPT